MEGSKGISGSFGPLEKERLDLPQLIVWQFQEPVWQVSRQLQGPDLEVSECLEGLEGLKEESGNFGPVEKERLDLLQLIVWQFQEPVWQVSRQLQGPDLEVSERLEGLKKESGSIGPVAKERFDLS